MNTLELRMYGIVPYNISDIQKGIQFGHGVVEYSQMVRKVFEKQKNSQLATDIYNQYNDWAENHKTFIILNGGTTNKQFTKLGTMNQHAETLRNNGIVTAEFFEPDLGDQLTSVNFIVDERVFNKKTYPEFQDFVETKTTKYQNTDEITYEITYEMFSTSNDIEQLEIAKEWRDLLGGEKNVFLRNFLKNLKLA